MDVERGSAEHPPVSTPAPSPPVSATGNVPAPRPSWPVVIGVIAIVVGSLGVISNGCGGLVSIFLPTMMRSMPTPAGGGPGTVPTAQFEVIEQNIAALSVNHVVLLGLAVLLIAAGIGLASRRRWCRRAIFIWAIARLLWIVPDTIIDYRIAVGQLEAVQQGMNTAGNPPMPGFFWAIMNWSTTGGLIIGVLLALALPVFMLIWFMRPKIKAHMRTWE